MRNAGLDESQAGSKFAERSAGSDMHMTQSLMQKVKN